LVLRVIPIEVEEGLPVRAHLGNRARGQLAVDEVDDGLTRGVGLSAQGAPRVVGPFEGARRRLVDGRAPVDVVASANLGKPAARFDPRGCDAAAERATLEGIATEERAVARRSGGLGLVVVDLDAAQQKIEADGARGASSDASKPSRADRLPC